MRRGFITPFIVAAMFLCLVPLNVEAPSEDTGYWMHVSHRYERIGLSSEYRLMANVVTNVPEPFIQCTWKFGNPYRPPTVIEQCNTTYDFDLDIQWLVSYHETIWLTVSNGYWEQEYEITIVHDNSPLYEIAFYTAIGLCVFMFSIFVIVVLLKLSKKERLRLRWKS